MMSEAHPKASGRKECYVLRPYVKCDVTVTHNTWRGTMSMVNMFHLCKKIRCSYNFKHILRVSEYFEI